jgi:hypothetical protein
MTYVRDQGTTIGFAWEQGWVVFCYFNGEWFVFDEEWQ